MKNPFPLSSDNKRYHTYHYYLTQRFSLQHDLMRLPRQSVDDVHPDRNTACAQTSISSQKIAYLQARTNTYAPVERLREVYEQALGCPGVVGLAVATRPDCLSEPVCDLLAEFSERTLRG